MTQPRHSLVSVSETPYYHVISRCVRRAFLCGDDRYSGRNYDHRRDWVLERLKILSEVFAIDVCSYAIMSNHFHLVVHLDIGKTATWTVDEVIDRWCRLFKGPELIQRYRAADTLSENQYADVSQIAEGWRNRLGSLSWYMRCLNEHIARKANAEDECTGHFGSVRNSVFEPFKEINRLN